MPARVPDRGGVNPFRGAYMPTLRYFVAPVSYTEIRLEPPKLFSLTSGHPNGILALTVFALFAKQSFERADSGQRGPADPRADSAEYRVGA
jgi:hypothetical protein